MQIYRIVFFLFAFFFILSRYRNDYFFSVSREGIENQVENFISINKFYFGLLWETQSRFQVAWLFGELQCFYPIRFIFDVFILSNSCILSFYLIKILEL